MSKEEIEEDLQVLNYIIAFYNSDGDCFDEDRYSGDHLKEAYEYYLRYNKDLWVGCDYVRLYAIVEKAGFVLLGDCNLYGN